MGKLITVTFELEMTDPAAAEPDNVDLAMFLDFTLAAADRTKPVPYKLGNATVFTVPVSVVVAIEGGIVQGGAADIPVELVTVDYDVDGAEEAEIVDVPQAGGGGGRAEGLVCGQMLPEDSPWIAKVYAAKGVEVELWGRKFHFRLADDDVIDLEMPGYTASQTELQPADLWNRKAVEGAIESYCLAAGIEPLDG